MRRPEELTEKRNETTGRTDRKTEWNHWKNAWKNPGGRRNLRKPKEKCRDFRDFFKRKAGRDKRAWNHSRKE